MPLDYSDLPVTTDTPTYATYQNYLRSALIERAAEIGATIVPPPVINAGDPIETTFKDWLLACRTAVLDILNEAKYGVLVDSFAPEFRAWDLFGKDTYSGGGTTGMLYHIHTYLCSNIIVPRNRYINDLFSVIPTPPFTGVEVLFASEDQNIIGGLIGYLAATDADHVAFQYIESGNYGTPVEIRPGSVANVYDYANQRFVRVRRNTAADLTGTGAIPAVYHLYKVAATPPIAGIVPMYGSYNFSIDTGTGEIGTLMATDANHVALKGRGDSSFGDPVEINNGEITSVFDATGVRFIRIKRTTAVDLSGSGLVYGTVTSNTNCNWMYYDFSELNPMYRSYYRELWFCVELMRYLEYSPDYSTLTYGGSSDGKYIYLDNYPSDIDAYNAGVAAYNAAPYGVAPGGIYITEVRSLADTPTPGMWGILMYINRYHNVAVTNQGPDIDRVYFPLLMETSLWPPILKTMGWSGAIRVGTGNLSFLKVEFDVGVDPTFSTNPVSPADTTNMGWLSAGSVGLREWFDVAGTTWNRNPVKGQLFTWQQPAFFTDALNPPTTPPA